MNLVKVAELLKNAPDQALVAELNNPSGGTPSYMVISELERRKKIRAAYQMEQGAPQSSVAEDAEQEVAAQMAPQMGLGAMPQAQQYSDMAPQQEQAYAGGGAVGYAGDAGSYVGDYEDDLPWEERMRKWREMTGFGRMAPPPKAPTAPVAPPATPIAPQVAPPAAPTGADIKSPLVRTAAAAAAAPTPKASANVVSAETGVNPNDVMARYRDLGEQTKAAYAEQAKALREQADELKNQKSSDIGFALMQAGLGIAAGRSSNAITNIGEGAMPAMQQYIGMDRERRKEAQRLALAQGQTGIASLEAQMRPLEHEATFGQGERKLNIMAQEVADKGAYQRGILARSGAAASMKLDPRIVAQGKAIEDEINDTIKMSEGLFGKQKEAAMARINALRQQKNALFGLTGADTGSAGIPQGVRDYSEFMRR